MNPKEQNTLNHEAAVVAAEVAKEAAKMAHDVACEAAAAAKKVAESVLVFGTDIGYIKNDISEIKTMLDNKYVTVELFDPVKRVVYGLVGVVLVSFVGAILALIIK